MLLEKVQTLCSENKTTITALERQLEFGNGSIRKWGSSYPGADKLAKVAEYFDVSVDELLGRRIFKPSDDAKKLAITYDELPEEKQNLIKCYISVVLAN